MPIKQTAGRDRLGGFAPEFARLNDDVLCGEVWSREGALPLKLRSIVTVSALIGKGITDGSLRHHLEFARANGVGRSEMAEILTHIAFYAGWPNAWAAFTMAAEVYGEAGAEESGHGGLFGVGAPNDGYAQYFSGRSWLKRVSREGDYLPVFNVTFEPGCRNNWHIHHGARQILICVSGRGWYQEWGKEAIALNPGDVIDVPEGVKHWHGAQKDSWFQHLATHVAVPNTKPGAEPNEWLEPVNDEEYNKLK